MFAWLAEFDGDIEDRPTEVWAWRGHVTCCTVVEHRPPFARPAEWPLQYVRFAPKFGVPPRVIV
jgi:hypothetical protein